MPPTQMACDAGLQWAKGDLNPHPLAGTWPSTMRVCLFRHSPLSTRCLRPQPPKSRSLRLLKVYRYCLHRRRRPEWRIPALEATH